MAGKKERKALLLRILETNPGTTQEELKTRLLERGIVASQSTLSRDLRELGAVKIPMEGGKSVYRYSDPKLTSIGVGDIKHAVDEFVVGIECIANLMVIKTTPGNARDFCFVLDRQKWREIVGTLAGDDNILVIARTDFDIEAVREKLSFSG